MPQTLMELMRHESIETTLKFYVGHNAEKTDMHLHNAISGNTSNFTASLLAPRRIMWHQGV